MKYLFPLFFLTTAVNSYAVWNPIVVTSIEDGKTNAFYSSLGNNITAGGLGTVGFFDSLSFDNIQATTDYASVLKTFKSLTYGYESNLNNGKGSFTLDDAGDGYLEFAIGASADGFGANAGFSGKNLYSFVGDGDSVQTSTCFSLFVLRAVSNNALYTMPSNTDADLAGNETLVYDLNMARELDADYYFDLVIGEKYNPSNEPYTGYKMQSVSGGSIPEPSTATLGALALAGLLARRRRK